LAYFLLGVKACVDDLNILLLDIKADNLLYSEDKDGKFPVFIDFSNDFVIQDQAGLMTFLTSFNQYYDTWTLEMMVFFIQIMSGKKNNKGIESLKKNIFDYRGIDLNTKQNKMYIEDISKKVLSATLLSSSKSSMHKENLKIFREKQMCYAIGRVYNDAYDKQVEKVPSFRNKKLEYILDNLQKESYFSRFMVNDAMYYIKKEITLNSRNDFLIKSKSRMVSTVSSQRLSRLNSLMDNLNLSNNPSLPSQLAPKLKSFTKKSKKVKNSISYKLEDITPKKLKKMNKSALVKIVKKYKNKNCKKITGLNKNEIIDRILLFQPDLGKKNLATHSVLILKKILNKHISNKCKVKQGDKKDVLHDFILKNIV